MDERELESLLSDVESDRSERTTSTDKTAKFGEAIGAFASLARLPSCRTSRSRFSFQPRSFNESRGQYGHLILQLSTQPTCGGLVRLAQVYSEGATESQADRLFLYSEAALNTMMLNASQAAMNRQQIFFDITPTNNAFYTLRVLEFR